MGRRPDVAKRIELVAHMAVRRIPTRAMSKALAEQGIVNPRGGKPWNYSTLARDVAKLEKEWRANATKELSDHRARDLAELDELARRAWAEKDYQLVLKIQERRAKLLGMDSPTVFKGDVTTLPAVLILPPEEQDPEAITEPAG